MVVIYRVVCFEFSGSYSWVEVKFKHLDKYMPVPVATRSKA
jgi:hypothetical protein